MSTIETITPLQSALMRLVIQLDRTACATGRRCVFCLDLIDLGENYRTLERTKIFGHSTCCETYKQPTNGQEKRR